jgi:hypothetical protein
MGMQIGLEHCRNQLQNSALVGRQPPLPKLHADSRDVQSPLVLQSCREGPGAASHNQAVGQVDETTRYRS